MFVHAAGIRWFPRELKRSMWHCACRPELAISTCDEEELSMRDLKNQEGKIGYIILWFLGVPASILILIFLLRGCT